MIVGPTRDRSPRVNADDVERLVVEILGRELSRPELSTDGNRVCRLPRHCL
jgi:hypothetical protein